MSYSCSNSAFTCNNASFSMRLNSPCPPTSFTPAVPAHHFNLFCPNYCPPLNCGLFSQNHGIACNAFNGYQPPQYIVFPGHTPSCAPCPTCPPSPCQFK